MKTTNRSIHIFQRFAGAALLGLLMLPADVNAKPKKSRGWDSGYHDGRDDYARRVYHAHPRSNFTITFGPGYAGRGYYYGPPGASYYYERPGVHFYGSRYNAPRYDEPRGYHANGNTIAVQRALYRRGYYRGPIDGDFGHGTRRAIARFEAEHGLPVRGYVSGRLLDALGLR